MTNVKSLKKAAAAIFAAVLCLSAVVFSGFQNVIPDMALQAEAAAADEYLTEFLNSKYDDVRATVYDGSNEENFMLINGRKYYQGLKLSERNYYSDKSYATYNVEDIDTISFTLGRVDNTDVNDATLTLYRDGEWWQNITIGARELWKPITLNVSSISTLKFELSGSCTYGLCDFSVDSYKPSRTYDSPKYSDEIDFLNSRYDTIRCTTYDGSNEYSYMMINGRKYYQGLKMEERNYYSDTSYATYNVENVSSLSFTVGRIDNTDVNDATLTLYKDGKWWQDITIGARELWKPITLNVSKASTIRFVLSGSCTYGLCDFSVDNYKPDLTFTKPTYENAIELLDSRYDSVRCTTYDGSNEFNYFSMNGKNYVQGLKMEERNYYSDPSYATFNTENIKSITFTFGRIDNTDQNNATLSIYKDGAWWYDIKVGASELAKQYTFDLTKTSTIRFVLSGGCTYGLANVVINDDYSAFTDGTYATTKNPYSNTSKIIDIDAIIAEEEAKEAAKANLGDVNEDGTVDSSDASKVLAAYAAKATGGSLGLTETQELNADVNMDDAVDSSDASSILGFYAYSATGGEGTMAEYMGV